MDLLTRFGLALGLCALGWIAYCAWNCFLMRRLQRNNPRTPGLERWQPGGPAILYFTTPECMPCKTVQRPALERLQTERADVRVIEIDATQQPHIADHWGVLAVPTTFVLDLDGKPRHLNHGVTPLHKLKQQLLTL